jgi:DNA repair protein RadC
MEKAFGRGVAEKVLERYPDLLGLQEVGGEELEAMGIPPEAIKRVEVVCEMTRRLYRAQLEKTPLAGPGDAARLLIPLLRHEKREVFMMVPLDAKGRAGRPRTISIGSLSASIVHPREVYHAAIKASAASIIVAHNHPSGDSAPSPEDVAVTKKLAMAGETMGIPLVDHIIVGLMKVSSLKDLGLL